MFASVMFGPNYEPQEPGPETIELFDTVGDAITALFERHRTHGRYPCNVDLLAGVSMGLAFPAFNIGTSFQLYDIGPENTDDSGHPLRFTDDQQSRIIEQVKTSHWDWYLILEHNGFDNYVRAHNA